MVDAEKVKAGLEHCDKYECIGCPYRGIEPTDYGEMLCFEVVSHDALEAIAQLEERIAIMQESMEALEKRCNTLDALEQRCNALEALEKRNEPVKPTREVGLYAQYFRCKKCDTLLVVQKQKYCFECGQAVKWKWE